MCCLVGSMETRAYLSIPNLCASSLDSYQPCEKLDRSYSFTVSWLSFKLRRTKCPYKIQREVRVMLVTSHYAVQSPCQIGTLAPCPFSGVNSSETVSLWDLCARVTW